VMARPLSRMIFAGTIGLSLTLPILVWAGDPLLPLPTADRKILVEQLGADVVGEPLPSRPIDDPNIFFSFVHRPVTYRFTSGRNKGKTQTLVPTKVGRPGGKFVWRVQLAPSLVGFLRHMLSRRYRR
jgi:hypothetical protein